MKISKAKLRQIIKEEIEKEFQLNEGILDRIKGMFGGDDPNEGVDPKFIKWVKESGIEKILKEPRGTIDKKKALEQLEDMYVNKKRYPNTEYKMDSLMRKIRRAIERADNIGKMDDYEDSMRAPEKDGYDLRGMQLARAGDFEGPCAELSGRELQKCMERERKRGQQRFDREHAGQDEDDGYRVHNTGAGYSAPWAE